MKECCTFIDDLIIPGCDFDEELIRVEHVLLKIRQHGLKLNPGKCKLFQKKVGYCGHVVSKDGIEADPEKTSKIHSWPRPSNVKEVREFLGFAGYYRRFVRDFAKIACPLTQLTGGFGTTHRKGKKKSPVLPMPWTWNSEHDEAFRTLKTCLTTPPVLAYADYSRPFIVHTDASAVGLGAVLSQKQEDGHERVIAYASRALRPSERNYPAHKLEFLALKWSVTEKYQDYLYGNRFTVVTDNNPLTYVLTSAKLDATGHRWLAALASYDFDIQYRPGTANVNADLLSRLPQKWREHQQDIDSSPQNTPVSLCDQQIVHCETISAICNLAIPCPIAQTICMSTDVIDDSCPSNIVSMQPRDIRLAQRQDPILGTLLPFITNKQKPTSGDLPYCPESQQFIREFPRLRFMRGILYRLTELDGEEKRQLVLPQKFREMALRSLHDDIGHLGRDKTLDLVRDRFYWPRMTTYVEEWIQKCDRCIRRKTPANIRAPLINIKTTQPLELVCIDYLSLEKSKGGFENILVITDHFTRYAQAIPTRNQTAQTTAQALINHFIVHYGLPQRIHSDQGANFMSKLMTELCKMLKIDKSHTTPYHPMGNGMTERFNRTLLSMLGTLDPTQKLDWKAHVAPLVHAYNATRHESTGYSPFFLMFGRQPRLPIDLILGITDPEEEISYTKYVEHLKKRFQDAYKLATKEADKARDIQKQRYDKYVRGATLNVGDRVLVKTLAHTGKDKLADLWEQRPYTVLQQPNEDIPVFIVQREDGSGSKRTLHRNHLLPISSLPLSPDLQSSLPATCKDLPNEVREMLNTNLDDADSDTEEENNLHLCMDQSDADYEAGDGDIDHPESTGENNEEAQEPEPEPEPEQEPELEPEPEPEQEPELEQDQAAAAIIVAEDADLGNDAVTESSSSDESDPELARPVRRSARQRKSPDRYGEWITKQHHVQKTSPSLPSNTTNSMEPWQQRASFLANLAKDNSFEKIPPSFCEAIVSIVSNH